MLRLPRLLTLCHDCAALTLRFIDKALWTATKCCACHASAQRRIAQCCACHEKTTRLHWTRFQSIAPVTKNAKMTSRLESLKRQNEHFVRDFLHFSHFEDDCVALCVCTAHSRGINDDTTTRRQRHDDDTTNTMRTQVQPETPTINGNPSLRIREKTK